MLLNKRPLSVPAYRIVGVLGSIANEVIVPPSGPKLVQTSVPGGTSSGSGVSAGGCNVPLSIGVSVSPGVSVWAAISAALAVSVGPGVSVWAAISAALAVSVDLGVSVCAAIGAALAVSVCAAIGATLASAVLVIADFEVLSASITPKTSTAIAHATHTVDAAHATMIVSFHFDSPRKLIIPFNSATT
jgi:hypothetical protein